MKRLSLNELLNNFKLLSFFSVLLSLIFIAIAMVVPQPNVTTLYLKNDENFFSMPMLKEIKSDFLVFAKRAIGSVGDKELQEYLSNKIVYPEWYKKNVTASYSINKEDTKELLDPNPSSIGDVIPDENKITESSQGNKWESAQALNRYRISSLDIETIALDRELSERAATWIGDYIIKLSFRRQYLELIRLIRDDNEALLFELRNDLPKLTTSLASVESRLISIKDVGSKNLDLYKQNSTIQYVMSPAPSVNVSVATHAPLATENKDRPDFRYNDETTYLPLSTQSSGLEIQRAQINAAIHQLQFRAEIAKKLSQIGGQEIIRVKNLSALDILKGIDIDEKIWASVLNYDPVQSYGEKWQKDYANGLIFDIHERVIALKAHLSQQQEELHNQYTKKFIRSSYIALLAGFLGLIILPCMRYGPYILAKLNE